MWCGGNGNQNKPLQIIFSFLIHRFIAYSNELAHAYICYQRAARSPSHADVYTHCHTAQSHTLVGNTHTPTCRLLAQLLLLATPCDCHSNRNQSYGFALPTNASSLLLSMEKHLSLSVFFSSHPHQKLPLFTINLSLCLLGLPDMTAHWELIFFLLPQKHKCKISRGL